MVMQAKFVACRTQKKESDAGDKVLGTETASNSGGMDSLDSSSARTRLSSAKACFDALRV